MRRLAGVSAGPSLAGRQLHESAPTIGELLSDVRDTIGRKLSQVVNRRELRRRRRDRFEYDRPRISSETWAWLAIIGTLALGLAAGALLHKLFIKAPTEVGKGMTVVQAKRMGFQALGTDGKGPQNVVSAVDDSEEEDEEDEADEEPAPAKKK